jgi:hypothetical protein
MKSIRGLTQVLMAFSDIGSLIHDDRRIKEMEKKEQMQVLREVIESTAKAMPDQEERDVLIGGSGVLKDLSLDAMLRMVGEVQGPGKCNKRPMDVANRSSVDLLSFVVKAYKDAKEKAKDPSKVKLSGGFDGIAQKGLSAWRDSLPPDNKKSSKGKAAKAQRARVRSSRSLLKSVAGRQQEAELPRPSRPASKKECPSRR